MIAAMRGTAHSVGIGLLLVAVMSGCGSTSNGPSTAKAALPPPAFAKAVNLSPVTGKVLVELPAAHR
jgi:hypothetical protein